MNISNLFNQSSQIVGHVINMDYQKAKIMSHDHTIENANFLPQGSFILIKVENKENLQSAILCRVLQIHYGKEEAVKIKTNSIQNLNSPHNSVQQQGKQIDLLTHNHLSYFEVDCKILGTFYEKSIINSQGKEDIEIFYGSDAYSFFLSPIYSVYKPSKESLAHIVNFVKKDKIQATQELLSSLSTHDKTEFNLKSLEFPIGKIRYASTMIDSNEKNHDTQVNIFPTDFIKQKTAIFGMTRTGKSNTVKNIAQSIMSLAQKEKIPIGQLIYDINGEYANDNEQNKKLSNSNLFSVDKENLHNGFLPALNNFYLNPDYGLQVIQEGIKKEDKGSNYLNVFLSINDITTSPLLFFLWICLLHKSSFKFPDIKEKLFDVKTQKKVKVISQSIFYSNEQKNTFENIFYLKFSLYPSIFNLIVKHFPDSNSNNNVLSVTEKSLNEFIKNFFKPNIDSNGKIVEHSFYKEIKNLKLDNELYYISLLGFIFQEDRTSGSKTSVSGWQMVVPYQYCHCHVALNDYRESIYQKLKDGNTVIIDFSIGDPFTRKYIADELMAYVFEEQISIFRKNSSCPIINIFIEEAHNVIGLNAAIDSLWPRVAKEGAKYNLGLLYATQEPSAIHHNILANTANFIVAHLNNDIEISALSNFADLKDFAHSIKNCEDVGFVRMKLLSKPYTIPVQIKRF